MVFAGIYTFKYISSCTYLLVFQVNKITAGAARVYCLISEHFDNAVNSLPPKTVHYEDIIANFNLFKKPPPKIVVGDQTDISITRGELKVCGCV